MHRIIQDLLESLYCLIIFVLDSLIICYYNCHVISYCAESIINKFKSRKGVNGQKYLEIMANIIVIERLLINIRDRASELTCVTRRLDSVVEEQCCRSGDGGESGIVVIVALMSPLATATASIIFISRGGLSIDWLPLSVNSIYKSKCKQIISRNKKIKIIF